MKRREGYCAWCKRIEPLIEAHLSFSRPGQVGLAHEWVLARHDVGCSGIVTLKQCPGSGRAPSDMPDNPLMTVSEDEYAGFPPRPVAQHGTYVYARPAEPSAPAGYAQDANLSAGDSTASGDDAPHNCD